MTAANHMITGAVLGAFFKQPLLVAPTALASHFVLDVLPHYGVAGKGGYESIFEHELTYLTEGLGIFAILLLLGTGLVGWNITLLGAVFCMLPDVVWIYEYFYRERHGRPLIRTGLIGFHRQIQWCERPWGLVVEIIFFVFMFWLLTILK